MHVRMHILLRVCRHEGEWCLSKLWRRVGASPQAANRGTRQAPAVHRACLQTARLRECGLTLRSSGAPTAGHQARSGGTRYIFASPGLASCRCRPLSSNVSPHTNANPGDRGVSVVSRCTVAPALRRVRLRRSPVWCPAFASPLNWTRERDAASIDAPHMRQESAPVAFGAIVGYREPHSQSVDRASRGSAAPGSQFIVIGGV